MVPVWAGAAWSGVSLSLDEVEADWIFDGAPRRTETTRIGLRYTETAASGLVVGARVGRLTSRLGPGPGVPLTEKYDAGFLGLSLHYPVRFGEHLRFYGELAYQYHSGDRIDLAASERIEWRDFSIELGLSGEFGGVRVTPFAVYSDSEGDISGEPGTRGFSSRETVSAGLELDWFVEQGGLIRLRLLDGAEQSAGLGLVREF